MPREVNTPAGKITFFTAEALGRVDAKVKAAMERSVILIENRVKQLMTGPKTGRWYRIGKTPTKANRAMGLTGRYYQASAPGEPPAVKSSRYLHSITHRVLPHLFGWLGEVGTNVKDYPRALEFGVKGGGTRRYRMTRTRERTQGGGRIVRVHRIAGPQPAGGWRLAPRPLWRRAMMELVDEIVHIWKSAVKGA